MTTQFLDKVAETATAEVPATVEAEKTPSSIRERLNVVPPGTENYLKHLFHADSGVGKTHLLGTAGQDENTGPVLVLDCEGGTDTLRGWPGVDVKPIRTMFDLQKAHEELFKYNQGWYKTVGIDSLSEIQDLDMRKIMKEAQLSSKNPENFNIDVPSPREWGIGRNHIRIVVRGFRDLPMNVIVTTLTNTIVKEGKADRYVPALPGKLGYEMPGFMGVVGWYHFTDGGNKNRVMQFKGTNRVMAKTRFKELGDILEDPTIPMIWNMIYNKESTSANT